MFAFIKVLVERSASTPKDVQKNGDTNARLVEVVLEEVKLNSFGVDRLEPAMNVERLSEQDVSSSFSSYNLFNNLRIEEVEVENDLIDNEDEVTGGITEECISRPVKIRKKIVKKRKAKVVCNLVNKRVNAGVEKDENLVLERCPGCHYDHFPLPKFCRWWKTRKNSRKAALKQSVNTKFNEDPVVLEKYIESLQSS